MSEINSLTADYESDHVALWLVLGVCSLSTRLRAVFPPHGATDRSERGAPTEFELLVLGVIAVSEALESLAAAVDPPGPPSGGGGPATPTGEWLR